ncbi:MAG: DNA cytosine methyltransferase [Hyphomonadaceae bacterium]|nr:DNA cytosine methyltransferase [Hyphomonadaceae bacterium]
MHRDSDASAYEFFAGGGMARIGLGDAWRVTFANDVDPSKTAAYAAAFGDAHLRRGDIWSLETRELPGRADLAWASFPCQDLSLAGARGGLDATRSGAFWGFWRLMEALAAEGRAPRILALENVTGLLTSRGGRDFTTLAGVLAHAGYTVGALQVDAAHFVPQSRPRVFVIAVRGAAPAALRAPGPSLPFHTDSIMIAHARLDARTAAHWAWWKLPMPPLRNADLVDLLDDPATSEWHPPDHTAALVAMMSPRQREKLATVQASGTHAVGALFRRVRMEDGVKVQRAEARFDGVAGCLRTPAGGSSRQTLLFVEGDRLRSRLMTAREGARLMGLPDDYPLPASQSRGLHLVGDGVAAPVVRWLSAHLLEPLARAAPAPER